MRSYELYLDESGQFIEEEKALSPSLIGGILVKKGDITIENAQNIMKEVIEKVHCNYVHILLSLKIRSLIDVQRKLLLCEKFLINLQENIIGKIKVKGFIINKLKLDIS